MKRNPRRVATAAAVLFMLTATSVAYAQKPGGILHVHAGDSPPSMSMLEEVDAVPARATMGVFNNLVFWSNFAVRS